jgi:hypothetical protein
MDTVAQCTSLAPQILGFIFFELFSNLGRTGCRRGRTPERPLRQPSQGLADPAGPFVCSSSRIAHGIRLLRRRSQRKSASAPFSSTRRSLDFRRSQLIHRAGPTQGHKLISQSVALRGSFALRWFLARFRFVI